VERQFGVPVGEGAGVPPGAFAEGEELGAEDDLVLKKKKIINSEWVRKRKRERVWERARKEWERERKKQW
jgi:hypothetical protein